MNNLNQCLIEGTLAKEPELKHTAKGTPICTFIVASNRFWKTDDELEKEVSFFDIVTQGELAENCAGQLRKGRGVRIIGRLKQERWQDNRGRIQSKVLIVADHVIFRPEPKEKQEPGNTDKKISE